MNFETFELTSRDALGAWQATNAEKEVVIIHNTLGLFELWVGSFLLAQLDTFETAKRFAECTCTFTVSRVS